MIACILVPGFALRAALRKQPGLALRPAALAPVAGTEPLLGPVTAEAERLGVRPGMRLGEGLATCPQLVLVEQDPAAAEQAWEEILRSLEDSGFAVDPAEPGCVYFETRGVERLYGGLEAALRRALAAVGTAWDPRAGAAQRRFAALAAANVARPGQILVVSDERLRDFLAPLPLELVPMEPRRRAELHELGVKRVGQLAGLPGAAVAERLGPDGRRAWGLARGGKAARVRGRRPPAEIVEALEFPEAVGNELTLRRAFAALLETVLARPERADRFVRKVALSARLVGGGSWRRSVTLRDATTGTRASPPSRQTPPDGSCHVEGTTSAEAPDSSSPTPCWSSWPSSSTRSRIWSFFANRSSRSSFSGVARPASFSWASMP